jgi:DNA gyrase subunit A
MGVRGITLGDSDEVVSMQISSEGKELLFVSEYGMGKRTSMEEFSPQHRGGKGLRCYKITEKTGNVISAKAVNEDEEIMMMTSEGIVIRIKVEGISVIGRSTSGVKLMNIDTDSDVTVASVAKVTYSDEEDLDGGVTEATEDVETESPDAEEEQ